MRDPFVHRVLTVIGITLASVLLVLFVWQAVMVLLLLFAGILFAVILTWLRDQLAHYLRLPRGLAMAICILLVVGFLSAVVVSVTPMIMEQVELLMAELPVYLDDLQEYLRRFAWGRQLLEEAPDAGELIDTLEGAETEIVSRLIGIFSTTFGVIAGVVVVLFIGIYLAAEPHTYINGILRLLPLEHRRRAREVLQRLGYTIRWWMLGQMLSMAILGTLTAIGLWLLGVPYALALGLLAAIMTFIPNLGPVLAAIPTLLVALAVSPELAVYVLILYVIIQNVEGYFITPMVHRRVIAMPPVVILTLQIFLLTLVGFFGVLLAMPLVACAMVMIRMLYVEDVLGDSFDRSV